ncbi:MAG: hypothetical protein ABSA68_12470 [Xanthobacteraceae bacterium]
MASHLHRLGARPTFELLCEIVGGADPLERLEVYGQLDVSTVYALGGDVMQPPAILVPRCR